MMHDAPEIWQFAGTALVLFALLAIAGGVYAVVRLFLLPRRGGPSVMDEYLASGAGNANPPNMPPSYSGAFRRLAGGSHATTAHFEVLDDPETQRRKFEESETTTTRELRNIE